MERDPALDVLVVGAGINGLYQLYRAREAGLRVQCIEAGSGVGGTWYWNRYPGARLDCEAYSYQYFFSDDLLDEWTWSEHFASQPELERYLNFVTDRFGLRDAIAFDTRVVRATWDEESLSWSVFTDRGELFTTRFLIGATGMLNQPYIPPYPGLDAFHGQVVHTARWPMEPVYVSGKRVAVIGTGSTGTQVIQELAPSVESLTVFQRTANWATPIHNSAISPDDAARLRHDAPIIWALTQAHPGCFMHIPRLESALDVSDEERTRYYQKLYDAPGLTLYAANFTDTVTDRRSNDHLVAFLTERISARVNDPDVRRKLIPNHGYSMKRPVLEDGFFETFNKDNVELIDLNEEGITSISEAGIVTTRRELAFDVIVLATGFDAVTGSFKELGVEGVSGRSLATWWEHGPRTFMGTFVHGFPNFFVIGGPQGFAGNQPRAVEFQVDWVTECMRDVMNLGQPRVEITAASEQEWVDHVNAGVQKTLLRDSQSWAWGSNIPGKARAFQMYVGTMPDLRARFREMRRRGYRGAMLGRPQPGATACPTGDIDVVEG